MKYQGSHYYEIMLCTIYEISKHTDFIKKYQINYEKKHIKGI